MDIWNRYLTTRHLFVTVNFLFPNNPNDTNFFPNNNNDKCGHSSLTVVYQSHLWRYKAGLRLGLYTNGIINKGIKAHNCDFDLIANSINILKTSGLYGAWTIFCNKITLIFIPFSIKKDVVNIAYLITIVI